MASGTNNDSPARPQALITTVRQAKDGYEAMSDSQKTGMRPCPTVKRRVYGTFRHAKRRVFGTFRHAKRRVFGTVRHAKDGYMALSGMPKTGTCRTFCRRCLSGTSCTHRVMHHTVRTCVTCVIVSFEVSVRACWCGYGPVEAVRLCCRKRCCIQIMPFWP